jgi:hypothetical protein
LLDGINCRAQVKGAKSSSCRKMRHRDVARPSGFATAGNPAYQTPESSEETFSLKYKPFDNLG